MNELYLFAFLASLYFWMFLKKISKDNVFFGRNEESDVGKWISHPLLLYPTILIKMTKMGRVLEFTENLG